MTSMKLMVSLAQHSCVFTFFALFKSAYKCFPSTDNMPHDPLVMGLCGLEKYLPSSQMRLVSVGKKEGGR